MVFIGDIVNTHGIKGELRILSDFKFKEAVFKENQKLYIGKRKQEVVIKTYRKHKVFDMVTFVDVDSINDAIAFKGDEVFVKREDLIIDGYVDEDIIGLDVYNEDKFVGVVEDIIKNKQEILLIKNNNKTYMVPFVEQLVEVDLKNKKIVVQTIEGLFDENWYFNSFS